MGPYLNFGLFSKFVTLIFVLFYHFRCNFRKSLSGQGVTIKILVGMRAFSLRARCKKMHLKGGSKNMKFTTEMRTFKNGFPTWPSIRKGKLCNQQIYQVIKVTLDLHQGKNTQKRFTFYDVKWGYFKTIVYTLKVLPRFWPFGSKKK